MRKPVTVCLGAAFALATTASPGAHKGITSKYTYNADVHPVFVKRCGRCHIDGGVGPMSLVKYEDAFPWAESIRTELLGAYPEAAAEGVKVDPHDFVKAAHRQISARELDVVLDWAAGGTPEGDKAATPQTPVFINDWVGGQPSLTASMVAPYQLPASDLEATQEFEIPLLLKAPQSVVQIDLLPGNPSIVRSAVLSLRLPDGTMRLLGTWVPRQSAAPIPLKPSVRIDPGARVVARIHYRKTWKFEGEAMTDQSSVGFYTAD